MKPCCVCNSREKCDERDLDFAAGLLKINRIILVILKAVQTFGINSFRILWTCCQAVETRKALSKAEICPMATVASIAEDHRVVSSIRKHIKNFLNTDFPVTKTPVSSPDFSMPSVVKDRLDIFTFACIKKSPNMTSGCGLGQIKIFYSVE